MALRAITKIGAQSAVLGLLSIHPVAMHIKGILMVLIHHSASSLGLLLQSHYYVVFLRLFVL